MANGQNPCIQKCKESGSGQGPEAPLSVVMVVRLNFCAQLSANLYLFCKICVQGDIALVRLPGAAQLCRLPYLEMTIKYIDRAAVVLILAYKNALETIWKVNHI